MAVNAYSAVKVNANTRSFKTSSRTYAPLLKTEEREFIRGKASMEEEEETAIKGFGLLTQITISLAKSEMRFQDFTAGSRRNRGLDGDIFGPCKSFWDSERGAGLQTHFPQIRKGLLRSRAASLEKSSISADPTASHRIFWADTTVKQKRIEDELFI